MPHLPRFLSVLALIAANATLAPADESSSKTWRSELYPSDWSAENVEAASFYEDKLIQDFSYAGYHSGEKPLPNVKGPLIDVTKAPFLADPSGTEDATAAIQAAIDSAAKAGGGVVLLPRGTYRLSTPPERDQALRVSSSNIVLRGEGTEATRLLHTTYQMRMKSVVRFAGPEAAGYRAQPSHSIPIAADLTGPTTRIPVKDLTPFKVGAWVQLRAAMTDDWVREHREPGWIGKGDTLGGFIYSRRIVGIDRAAGVIVIDIPTRYALLTRDAARVHIPAAEPLTECGIESLSIGNLLHPGKGWKENDYTIEGTAAYDLHDSWLINFDRVRNGWIREVDSFRPAENTLDAHLLSNGIRLRDSRGITVVDCHLQRSQYGGGGGNGYLYRVHSSGDNLLLRCIAERTRHGFVFSHPASAGNVFHACIDRDTGYQVADTGNGKTNGRSSDHHAWFSHSNLIDSCTADSSWFEANFRPWGAATKHNLTAAHSVFWNTTGLGTLGPVVSSEQSRYGYVIGTSGTRSKINRPRGGGDRCDPPDHVEGEGLGEGLQPQSLYLNQVERRLGRGAVERTATGT